MSERQIRRAHERQVERDHTRKRRLGRKAALATGAALGAAVVFAPAAQADEVVNSLDDDGNADCDDAECTLREAVIESNQASGDDVITFASGLTGTIYLYGPDSTYDSDIEIYNDALQIQGPGAGTITVDGYDEVRIFQLYDFTDAGEQNSISGLTLANGNTGGNGGAIDSDDEGAYGGNLALDGLVITDSYSGDDGGAVRFDAEAYGDTLTITNSTIADNIANDAGGGLYSVGGNVTISGSTISGNDSENGQGGGAYTDYGDVTIVNSVFSDNDAAYGGGAYVQATLETGVEVQSSVFIDNYSGGYGGALYLSNPRGPVEIANSTFASNRADGGGGGVYVNLTSYYSDLTISSSTFSGNIAGVGDPANGGYGGGLLADDVTGDTVIQNSTFSGNEASYNGGGIQFWYLYEAEGQTTTIRNSTIVDNAAGTNPGDLAGDYGGGGIYLYDDSEDVTDPVVENGPVLLSSTIVANNTGVDFGNDLGQGEFADGFDTGFSLVESGSASRDPSEAEINETPAGSNIFGVDPLLGPLAANGGPTETHLPAANSAAIDAGVANGLATDQRGVARTFDAVAVPNNAGSDGTDIGSVEVQPGEGGLPGNAQCQGATVPEFKGTDGNDTLSGTPGSDFLRGLAGNDTASGAAGNDCVNGDAGRDNVKGGPGKDVVKGGGGRDRAAGGGGKDKVKGNAGKDRLKGGGGNDKLSGAKGKDTLKGGGGKDRLKGGPGKDKLKGGGGKDRFNCGGGNDKVTAQPKDKVSANCEKVVEPG